MRPLILITVAALLTTGCDKPQEKPAPSVTAPKPEPTRRPVAAPPQIVEAPMPVVTTTSPAEVEAYLVELETLAKQVESLDQSAPEGSPEPDFEALQKSFSALVARRSRLMAGSTPEGKKELADKFLPAMKRIGPVLHRRRSARALERFKRPEGAGPSPDNVPGELLEELPVPSEERPPPAPAPGNGTPPPQ